MIRLIAAARIATLGGCAVVFAGCELDGRPRRSTCQVDITGTQGVAWIASRIDYYLTEPSDCPMLLSATTNLPRHFYAMVTAPPSNIQGYDLYTAVYNASNESLGSAPFPWYYVDYNTLEADIDFQYTPGTGSPVAGYFSDRAVTSTLTSYGVGSATAMLTYRKGLATSMQGPPAPTPGTNVMWSVAAENATGPHAYRWFKDGVELPGQTSSSLTLPVTNAYFTLGAITQSPSEGADTLQMAIVPGWHVNIYGMSDRSPDLSTSCGYTSDTGTNPSSTFSYEWYLDGTLLPDNAWTANPTFALGSHMLELIVTDGNGYTAHTSMAITVVEGGPSNCM